MSVRLRQFLRQVEQAVHLGGERLAKGTAADTGIVSEREYGPAIDLPPSGYHPVAGRPRTLHSETRRTMLDEQP
jgi:hypothetical protein